MPYPDDIFTPRTLDNVSGREYDPTKPTRLFAEDINFPNAEIVAIETILGLNVNGEFDTVVEWLQWLTDNGGGGGISNLDGGTATTFYSALDPIEGGDASGS